MINSYAISFTTLPAFSMIFEKVEKNSAIQFYHFNNKIVVVDLVEAHELSSTSQEILHNLMVTLFLAHFELPRH
jgi:hypothetical protein